jgi:hypothetical protein
MKEKLYVIYVLPLRLMLADIREVVSFTRGLFR